MIYIGYLLILLLLLLGERFSSRNSWVYRIIIPILYVLLIGLRGPSIGVDTPTYYEHYYVFGQWGADFIEPGFDWLNRYLYAQGYGAEVFFTAIAAITVFFIFLTLNRLDKREYTISALCLYFFTFTFLVNGMRQGVACAVFLYAYKFIEDRKPIYYLLLIGFAALFHFSALLLLPLYFLGRYHLPTTWYIAIYILSFVGVFMDISAYIPQINIGIIDYSDYIENLKLEQASYVGFIVTTILNILILLLMVKNGTFKTVPLLSNLIFLSFILKNIGFNIPIVGRVTIYFSWFVYLLYPIILSSDKRPLFRSHFLTVLLILAFNVAIESNAILSPANKILPYRFFWEESR